MGALEQHLLKCRTDFRYFARHHLSIRRLDDSDGGWGVCRFENLRSEQEAVLGWVEWCIRNGVPVRVIIDKCRDLGMSTIILGIAYWLATFHGDFEALLIAQQKDATVKIGEIATTFNKHLGPLGDEGLKAVETINGLYWKNESMIEWTTQRSEDARRGSRPSFVHASEYGSWHKKRAGTSERDVLASLLGAFSMVPGTYFFKESTAQGPAGAFYDDWLHAIRRWKRDDPKGAVWRPFFFSWQGVPKYQRLVTADVHNAHSAMMQFASNGDEMTAYNLAKSLGYVDQERGRLWFDRSLRYGLTATEMAWAMAKLEDLNDDIHRFDQEYPLTWQMSFATSGSTVFSQGAVDGFVKAGFPDDTQLGAVVEWDADKGGRVAGTGDQWQVYVKPVDLHEYVVGVDTASGSPTGDYTSIQVLDRNTGEFVAEFYGKVPPDVAGEQSVAVARWYNSALINPEENNDGGTTIRRILDMGYGYVQLRYPGRGVQHGRHWRQVYGTKVTAGNRDDLVNLLKGRVRKREVTIYSRRLLDEMRTFVYDDKGHPDHMSRCHSDAIFGAIHAVLADSTLGTVSRMEPVSYKHAVNVDTPEGRVIRKSQRAYERAEKMERKRSRSLRRGWRWKK